MRRPSSFRDPVELLRFLGQVLGHHSVKHTAVDDLLLVVDRAEVSDRLVTTLALVVALNPERQIPWPKYCN